MRWTEIDGDSVDRLRLIETNGDWLREIEFLELLGFLESVEWIESFEFLGLIESLEFIGFVEPRVLLPYGHSPHTRIDPAQENVYDYCGMKCGGI